MINDQAAELRKAMARGKSFLEEQKEESKLAPTNKEMKIITITSGKGGVGKSNFTANLATSLTKRGKSPIVFDADLGLANIEILLGAKPQHTLTDVIKKECSLKETISIAPNGVKYISGGSGVQEMAFLNKESIENIGKELVSLKQDTDLLLIDTGAGINDAVLNFSVIADEIIVVVVPEPSSVADSYSLLKTLTATFEEIPKVKILVNKVVLEEDAKEVFERLEFACSTFLKLKIEMLGMIPQDDNIPRASREQMPISDFNANSKASVAYFNIASKICSLTHQIDIPKKSGWLEKFKKVFGT